jgi:hypothetical protein
MATQNPAISSSTVVSLCLLWLLVKKLATGRVQQLLRSCCPPCGISVRFNSDANSGGSRCVSESDGSRLRSIETAVVVAAAVVRWRWCGAGGGGSGGEGGRLPRRQILSQLVCLVNSSLKCC